MFETNVQFSYVLYLYPKVGCAFLWLISFWFIVGAEESF